MAKYKMLKDSKLEPRAKTGCTVYSCAHSDYGMADDDTCMSGVVHVSVTLNSDGSYPFFTVPTDHVERASE